MEAPCACNGSLKGRSHGKGSPGGCSLGSSHSQPIPVNPNPVQPISAYSSPAQPRILAPPLYVTQFAHGKCVQRWCNEKKNTICEICHQPYQAGYTASYVPCAEDTALDIGEGLHIPGNPREVHFQRVVAATAEEEHLLEAEYEECATASGTRTTIIRSSFLILLAVMMMRHVFSLVDEDDNNDLYNLLSVFLLRILAFLMPVYIMAWVATVLVRRSQRHGSGFFYIA